MKRSRGPVTTKDPTQQAAPPAAFTDRSGQPPMTAAPLRGAHAPAGAAGYDIHQPQKDQQHLGLHEELSHLVGMTKHASDAGLAGVAEAAGHLLGELTPASMWRQELLQTRATAGIALGLMLGYALLLAPRKLGFWGEAALVVRGCSDNALSFVLFNMLGIMPALLGCVAWPLLRNRHYKARPLRPYLIASFGTGAFALLSYIARWDPPKRPAAALPPARLVGRTAWLQRLSESRVLPATLLASTLYLYSFLAIATPATWAHFGYLLSHSMTVNVMMVDFTVLALLSSWLVVKDASARGLGLVNKPAGRWALAVAMMLAPAVGPGVYLMIRPVSVEGYGIKSLRKDIVSLLLLPAQWVQGLWQQAGSSRALRRSAEIHVGSSAAAAANHAADVAAAATVPLPSSLRLAARSVEELVSDSWQRGCLWFGQCVARLRGGGANVASSDDAFGTEMDVQRRDAGPVPPGEAGHTSETTGRTPAQRHRGFWQQQQQQRSPLGPGPSPVKMRAPDGGMELLFSNDYDEYEADISETSSDMSDDDLSDILTDSDDLGADDLDADEESGEAGGGAEDHHEDEEPLDEDAPEVQDEEEDELFDVPPATVRVVADQGLANGAAVGTTHGSRPAKEAALRKLAELGLQEHPKLAATGSSMH